MEIDKKINDLQDETINPKEFFEDYKYVFDKSINKF